MIEPNYKQLGLCAAFAVFVFLATAAGDEPSAGIDLENIKARLSDLRGKVPKAMYEHRSMPGKASLPLGAEAGSIRALLIKYEGSRTQGPDPEWAALLSDSFRVSLAVEWTTFSEAEQHLKEQWQLLGAGQPGENNGSDAALSALKAARDCVAIWLSSEPEACSKIIDEAEAWLNPSKDRELLSEWSWSFPYLNRNLAAVARQLPEPRRTLLLTKVHGRDLAFWSTESIPLPVRTRLVALTINQLYSSGEISSARKLLLDWETHNPAALQNEFWLFQRYFLSAVGEGDQKEAANTFRLLEQRVVAGSVAPEDDIFKSVSQHYYAHLPQSGLLYSAQAAAVLRQHDRK